MSTRWKCHRCWAQNEAHATECSYCGTSLVETQRRSLEDTRTKSRKKRTLTIVKIVSLLIGAVILPIAARAVWHWHKAATKAAAVDHQERFEKDQILDTRGQPAQCEITEEMHIRNLGSRITCTFVVNDQEYSSYGPTPLNYKFKYDTSTGPRLSLAPGNFVKIVYDPQNPSLNRIDGDRFLNHAIDNPLGLEVTVAVVLLSITILFGLLVIWAFWSRRKTIAAILSGKDVLTKWKYSPDEWQIAVRDEFSWVKDETQAGQVYITPSHILITNGKDKLLSELASRTKVVTLASYLQSSPLGLLRFRTRWKTVVKRKSGFMTVDEDEEYGKQDHRIPVPPEYETEARRLSDYFQALIDMNVAAVQNVLPRSKSLLGRDAFED